MRVVHLVLLAICAGARPCGLLPGAACGRRLTPGGHTGLNAVCRCFCPHWRLIAMPRRLPTAIDMRSPRDADVGQPILGAHALWQHGRLAHHASDADRVSSSGSEV